jgi:arginine decarboxylase
VGAYQETLGDIHNLFGDTDTANVSVNADGSYTLVRQRRGDTTDVMLDYVGYKLDDLRASYKARVSAAKLPGAEAEALLAALGGTHGLHVLAGDAAQRWCGRGPT